MGNKPCNAKTDDAPQSWREPFLRALRLHGRPESRFKWYVMWANRFTSDLPGKLPEQANQEDAERFLASLASSERIAPWQVDQAADALAILLGSVFLHSWSRRIRVPAPPPPPEVNLPLGEDPVEHLRYALRCRRYSVRTEQAYVHWVNRFLAFCQEGEVSAPGTDAVRAFLERLVMAGRVSAATQAQALNALAFYFNRVLGEPFGDLGDFQRSKRSKRLPVVLPREEVRRLFDSMAEGPALPVGLLYGSGLRLMECLRLRVKDLDLEARQITVRDGKGQKDRVTVLSERWRGKLIAHLQEVRAIHARDLEQGYAGTTFWPALERKLSRDTKFHEVRGHQVLRFLTLG